MPKLKDAAYLKATGFVTPKQLKALDAILYPHLVVKSKRAND